MSDLEWPFAFVEKQGSTPASQGVLLHSLSVTYQRKMTMNLGSG